MLHWDLQNIKRCCNGVIDIPGGTNPRAIFVAQLCGNSTFQSRKHSSQASTFLFLLLSRFLSNNARQTKDNGGILLATKTDFTIEELKDKFSKAGLATFPLVKPLWSISTSDPGEWTELIISEYLMISAKSLAPLVSRIERIAVMART